MMRELQFLGKQSLLMSHVKRAYPWVSTVDQSSFLQQRAQERAQRSSVRWHHELLCNPTCHVCHRLVRETHVQSAITTLQPEKETEKTIWTTENKQKQCMCMQTSPSDLPRCKRDCFLSSDLEKCSISITCSLMDPLQWMGAVRMRDQTADKNITIIHKQSTPLQSIS